MREDVKASVVALVWCSSAVRSGLYAACYSSRALSPTAPMLLYSQATPQQQHCNICSHPFVR